MTQPNDSGTQHLNPAAAQGAREWDERYDGAEQVWSGQPNAALLAELAGLGPGRALDVGCGEGADAVWLAGRGWQVTALDISQVAIGRGRSAAQRAGVELEWIDVGLLDAPLGDREFDLVSAQYPALSRTPGADAERALLDAVASRGHLLVVHHLLDDAAIQRARAHGFDPTDYVSPADVAALLDDRWHVDFDERRPRDLRAGAGAHHAHDVVLHARRLS